MLPSMKPILQMSCFLKAFNDENDYSTCMNTTQHLFSCPQIRTTLSALVLWRDLSGVATLLDDWREKLAANPCKTTEADAPQ